MDKYRIEPFSIDRFSDLQALFKSTIGVALDIVSFQKRYATENVGGKGINYIAVLNATNEIVSHYGALPVKVLIDGKEIIAAQLADAMTAKEHRRQGLFNRLADEVHEVCRRQGVELVFSQPNATSPYFRVLNVHHIDDITRWDLKTRMKTLPLAKLFVSSGFHSLYLRYCKKILQRYNISEPTALTNTIHSDDGRVVRDKAYLRYKQTADKCFLKIGGVIFWVRLIDVFWIGEIDDYSKVDERVLRKLRQLAFRLGYNTISFHLNQKVLQPDFLKAFRPHGSEATTTFYLNERYKGKNLILTGADFDIW